jgi:dihydroflavonol-4-reductase
MSNSIPCVGVTGATGHLGSVLARRLLNAGYRVRAIVRSASRLRETPWVQGKALEVAEADVTDAVAMTAALSGLTGVFHVAAAFDVARLSATELYRVNVGGTETVLKACATNGVRRIVLTSSAAAVGTSGSNREIRNEDVWNDGTRENYARSKVLAERKAWELAEKFKLDLVTVLPGAILGPGFLRLTPTLAMVDGALKNAFPMVPPIDFAFTDVRDVANAQIRLFETGPSSRYLLAGPTLTFQALLQRLHALRTDVRVPKEMPGWFARLLPVLDAMSHLATRAPRTMRSGFVTEYVGRSHALSTERAVRAIGWSPRAIEATLADTLTWLKSVENVTLLDS